MKTCCKMSRKAPVQIWEVNKLCTVQRPLTEAEGATVNTHNEISLTLESNWTTVGTLYFAIRPMRGRQVVESGNVVDVVSAEAYCPWSSLGSAINPNYRLILGDVSNTSTRKVYQVCGKIDFWENEEWLIFSLAEFKVAY